MDRDDVCPEPLLPDLDDRRVDLALAVDVLDLHRMLPRPLCRRDRDRSRRALVGRDLDDVTQDRDQGNGGREV